VLLLSSNHRHYHPTSEPAIQVSRLVFLVHQRACEARIPHEGSCSLPGGPCSPLLFTCHWKMGPCFLMEDLGFSGGGFWFLLWLSTWKEGGEIWDSEVLATGRRFCGKTWEDIEWTPRFAQTGFVGGFRRVWIFLDFDSALLEGFFGVEWIVMGCTCDSGTGSMIVEMLARSHRRTRKRPRIPSHPTLGNNGDADHDVTLGESLSHPSLTPSWRRRWRGGGFLDHLPSSPSDNSPRAPLIR